MKKNLFYSIISFVLIQCIQAQNIEIINGLLQREIDNYIKDNKIPGISAAICYKNNVVWQGVSGISSENDSINTDMLFGIGSTTKNFTAAIILQLIEEGELNLNDTIGEWLSNFTNIDESATIKELLNHTSGIYNLVQNPDYIPTLQQTSPDKHWNPEEIINQFVKENVFEPGSQWEYSNTNYLILGLIIEKITHSKISEVYRTRLFEPLNLSNTFYIPEENTENEIAHIWGDYVNAGYDRDITQQIPLNMIFSSTHAAGGIFSTASDLAIWGYNLFEGEILSSASLQVMKNIELPSEFYGLGLIKKEINNRIAYGHSGGFLYSADYYYFPEDRMSLSILRNKEINIDELIKRMHQIWIDSN